MKLSHSNSKLALPVWAIALPLIAWIVFFIAEHNSWPPLILFSVAALIGSVLSAVHHAEVISHRVGEPFGALVLALAVTVIEVSLIVSLMLSGGPETSVLARDTVFSAVMIILNGMIGLSILIGGIKFKEQTFTLQGISTSLTVLVAISVLTLILPNYTITTPGPFYSKEQLIFVAIITFILYLTFLFVQNIRHKAHFLSEDEATTEHVAERPSLLATMVSLAMLIVCLGSVVFLAELLAPDLEAWIKSIGAPVSLSGVIIACIVLLPEGLSAVRAAKNNQLQKSFNLSLGSALASIGLTIPAVSMLSIYTGLPLSLGIGTGSTVLFLLTLFIIMLSLSTGKTTIMQGIVLLLLFSVSLFIIIFP
jgi:Ca2+:H+ antiporter